MSRKSRKRRQKNWYWMFRMGMGYKKELGISLLLGYLGIMSLAAFYLLTRYFLMAVFSGTLSRLPVWAGSAAILLAFSLYFQNQFAKRLWMICAELTNDLAGKVYWHQLYMDWDYSGENRKELLIQEEQIRQAAEGITVDLFSCILLSLRTLILSLLLLFVNVFLFLLYWFFLLTGNVILRCLSAEKGEKGDHSVLWMPLFDTQSMQYLPWIQIFQMQEYFFSRFSELRKKSKRVQNRRMLGNMKAYFLNFWLEWGIVLMGIGFGYLLICLERMTTADWMFGIWILFALKEYGFCRISFEKRMKEAGKAVGHIRALLELPPEIRLDEEWTGILRHYGREGLSVCCEQVTIQNCVGSSILKEVSWEAHPGEWVAIDGEFGDNQSTLVRLLLGQSFPDSGEIYLTHEKGIRCRLSASTRCFITYISEKVGIFPGTVADNLSLGREDIRLEDLWEALDLVFASEFVRVLPQGIHTLIGEGGIPLSRCQVQQLILARGILADTPVYVIESGTGTLSPALERDIYANLHRVWKKKTCLFLNPPLQILARCDRIYQLELNEILPSGELLDPYGMLWEDMPCDMPRIVEVFAPVGEV